MLIHYLFRVRHNARFQADKFWQVKMKLNPQVIA